MNSRQTIANKKQTNIVFMRKLKRSSQHVMKT